MFQEQYITDNTGKKVSVIIPIKDYFELIQAKEELDDIRLYDLAKSEKSEQVPIDIAFEDINPLPKAKN
jgi:poly(A) polymerase Pap1